MKSINFSICALLLFTISYGQSFEFKQFIVPSDTGVLRFGSSISQSGSHMIIGSMSNSTDETYKNKKTNAGAAYIYSFQFGSWNLSQKVVASDRSNNSFFGVSVCSHIGTSGAEFLIGADEADYVGSSPVVLSGKVYYFTISGNKWTEKQQIVPSDVQYGDKVGSEVRRLGDELFIEASQHDYDSAGNNYIEDAGAVYYFKLENGSWVEKQKIVAYDRNTSGENFGRSIAFDGNHLFVGSLNGYDENGTNFISNGGTVYVYNKNVNNRWVFKQKIRSSDIAVNDGFGVAGMDAQGNRLVVGSRNGLDISGKNEILGAGSTYIFKKDGNGDWNEEQKIVAEHRGANGEYGHSVSIDGSNIVVGSPFDKTDAFNSNSLTSEGAAYIYKLNNSGVWEFNKKIVADIRRGGSLFGSVVQIENTDILVTSERDRAGTIFQNGSAHYFGAKSIIGMDKKSNSHDQNIIIFPNPTASELNIKTPLNIEMIRIFDQQGRLVLEDNVIQDRKINVSELFPSIYLMKIFSKNGVTQRKFVKIQ